MAETRQRLSSELKKKFIDDYLDGRDHDLTIKKAYDYARSCAARESRPVPPFNTFNNWLYCGAYADEMKAGATPSHEEKIGVTPIHSQVTPLDLLRLYRFRREEDIDAIVDRLYPDLGKEEHA